MQSYLAGDILKYNMNFESLINAQQVSTTWREAIVACKLWKKLYKNQVTETFFTFVYPLVIICLLTLNSYVLDWDQSSLE